MNSNRQMDLTVIIPVHEMNETVEKYLTKAVDSVLEQTLTPYQVMFVCGTSEIEKELKRLFPSKKITKTKVLTVVNETGDTDYCSQVNVGVNSTVTKHFSILEFDDTYKP